MAILSELKRRKVFRVAIAYAVVGWLLAQIAETTFPILLLPDWLLRAFVVALILGFPLAAGMAWAFEIRPEKAGEARDNQATASTSGRSRWQAHALTTAAGLAFGLLAGGMIARSVLTDATSINAVPMPVRLTANPADKPVIGAALSPDGNLVAFSQTDGLHLRIVESGATQKLPLPEEFQIKRSRISWFPDGAHLLFTADIDYRWSLWKLAIVGGRPTKLGEDIVHAALSKDGKRIAFLPRFFGSRIRVMDADGGNVRLLADLEGDYAVRYIDWSADGRYLLAGTISGSAGDRNVLVAIETASGTVHTVFEDERFFQNWRGFLPFIWTGDDRLLFARRELSPNQEMSNLWQLRLDPETANPDGVPQQITRLTGFNFADLSVASNGRRTAFLLEENQADVLIGELASDGAALTNIYRQTVDERDEYPRGWAPDSSTLYIGVQRGLAENLLAVRPGEAGAEPVLSGSVGRANDSVSTSPDGRWIMYWDDTQLYRLSTAGGASELVLEATDISADFACPKPDTARRDCIVGMPGGDNRYVFYAFDPEHGLGERLVSINDRRPFTNWALSPDALSIAVVHNNGGLRIVDLPTGRVREISEPGWSFGEFVDWSADGDGVYVDGYRGKSPFLKLLMHYSLTDREISVLRDTPSEWHVHPRASPDGRFLAFSAMRFSGNVWMIESDD